MAESYIKRDDSDDRFTEGTRVQVLVGPFTGMTGEITEVDTAKRRASVQLDLIGGRPPGLELSFDEIMPESD